MENNKSDRFKYFTDILRALAHLMGGPSWEGFLIYKIQNAYTDFRKCYLAKYLHDNLNLA